jgi:hypothetical protein
MMMAKTKKKVQTKNPLHVIAPEIKIKAEHSSSTESILSPEVAAFLDKHPFLKPILAEAPDKIRKFFPNARIEYKVVEDPEEIDSQIIVIYVYTHLSVKETTGKLELLDKDWYLDACSKGQCKIFIKVVCQ